MLRIQRNVFGICLTALSLLSTACHHTQEKEEAYPSVFVVNQQMASLSISAEPQEISIPVASDLEWAARISEGDWLQLRSATSQLSDAIYSGKVLLQATFNNGTSARTAQLTVTSGLASSSVTITQAPLSALVSPQILSLSGRETAWIETHFSGTWTLEADADWLQISPLSGQGASRVKLTAVDDNSMNVGARSAELHFRSGQLDIPVLVSQGQTNNLLVRDHQISLTAGAGSFTVQTLSNVDYQIEILQDEDWLSRGETRALLEQEEPFLFVANERYASRTATIRFYSADVEESVLVTQEGLDPILETRLWGAYGLGDLSVSYQSGTHQLSRMRGGQHEAFRILDPAALRVTEMDELPTTLTVGQAFPLRLRVLSAWETLLDQYYDVRVIGEDDTTLWLKHSEDIYFLIKK